MLLLLIENRTDYASHLKRIVTEIKTWAFEVEVVDTLVGAREALAAKEYDAILLNLDLPDSNGIETLITVSRQAPDSPVIVLEAQDGLDMAFETARHGAQGYIPMGTVDVHMLSGVLAVAIKNKARERRLEQSEKKFRNIIESLEDAYYEADLKGHFQYMNPAGLRHYGRKREEIIGANFRQFTAPELIDDYVKLYREIYKTGKSDKIVDNLIIREDGSTIFTEINLSLMRDAKGNPIGFSGISRDVTEKKRTERALTESEEKYRGILESIEDGYYEFDIKGRFSFFNDAMCRILGYDRQTLLSMTFRDVMPTRQAEDVYKTTRKVLRSGKPKRAMQCEIIRGDGAKRFMEFSVSVLRDVKGRRKGVRGIGRDVTERKEAEVALAEAKERAEAATQAKSDFLANMSHEIRTPLNGIIGMYNLLMDTPLTREQRDFATTGKNSASSLFEIVNDILDFSKIEAGKMNVDIIDFDLRNTIGDLVAAPAMLAHVKALEFIYDVDPQVPSLLRGDPGRLRQVIMNLITNAIKFTSQGEVVFRIFLDQSSQRNVVLRFSVEDTGIGISQSDQSELFESFQQVDTSTTRDYGGTGLGLAICKRLVELMDGQIGVTSEPGKGSTFWFTIPFEQQREMPYEPLVVDEDIKGKRILIVDDNQTNLKVLSGYMDSWHFVSDTVTSAAMAISAMHSAASSGRPYDLVISDMQMPEVDGAELGHRIKSHPLLAQTRLILLTSLGIRGDAAKMRRIGFSGYLTKPVRRSLLLDCIKTVLSRKIDGQENQIGQPIVSVHSLSDKKRREKCILLAEDNPVNQKLALHMLKRIGLSADVVSNGAEALEALASKFYDLVLMDVQMPVMDGLEASRQIRNDIKRALNPSVVIIAMTANATKGDRDKCLQAGMTDYIPKPIKPEILLSIIEKYLFA